MSTGTRQWIVASLILVEILAAIWLFPYLPMTDLPEHMLAAQVLTHYSDAETRYSDFFDRHFPWNPYSSYFLFVMALKPLLGVSAATRLYLSLAMVLTVFSLWYWIRIQAPGREAQIIPATLLLFGYFFYLGLINFLFSAAFLFLAVALNWKLLHSSRSRWRLLITLSACLLLAYLSHIVTFALCGLTIVVQCMAFRPRRLLWSGLPFVPSMVLFLAFSFTEGKGAVSDMTLSWDPLLTRVRTLLLPFNIFYDPLPGHWVYDASWLILLAASSVIMAAGWLRRDRSSVGLPAVPRVAWMTLALFVAGTVFLPSNVAGGLGIALRASYFAGFFLIALCPSDWDRSLILRTLMFVVCVVSPVFFAVKVGPFTSEMKDLERAVHSIPAAQVIQPVITELHSGTLQTYPFLHAAAWYSYYRGGTSPYLFARWAKHFPISARTPMLPRVTGEWTMQQFDFASNAAGTDYFLVRTNDAHILDDFRQHVPLHAQSGDWLVFGPQN
jgi:hypothetical protein